MRVFSIINNEFGCGVVQAKVSILAGITFFRFTTVT